MDSCKPFRAVRRSWQATSRTATSGSTRSSTASWNGWPERLLGLNPERAKPSLGPPASRRLLTPLLFLFLKNLVRRPAGRRRSQGGLRPVKIPPPPTGPIQERSSLERSQSRADRLGERAGDPRAIDP